MDVLAIFPLGLDQWFVPMLIGFGFGFVLESSGFGDSRRLAAQFYLTEMRVLKVMFTAIVTCMVLLAWFSAVGWLDFDKVFVNPTYLGSGIVGGLLLYVWLITPAAIAFQFFHNVRDLFIAAPIIAASASVTGAWFGLEYSMPVGPLTAMICTIWFLVAVVISPKRRISINKN